MARKQPPPKVKSRALPVTLALLVGLAIGAGGIFITLQMHTNQSTTPTPTPTSRPILDAIPIIPAGISTQLLFPVLAPNSAAGYTLDTFNYDKDTGVLSFTAHGPVANFTITEQATPDNFTEIPEYFDKLVESLLEYKRFDTELGRVSLTRPKEFSGQQAGVINARGTLMFSRPDKELTEEEWRMFYKQIEGVK